MAAQFDEKIGEWVDHSKLTGRDYFGSTRARAEMHRQEAERFWTAAKLHELRDGTLTPEPATSTAPASKPSSARKWRKVNGARSVRKAA